MVKKSSTKPTMNSNPSTATSGSTLWTSTSKQWTKLSLENVDVEEVLQKNIAELKQQSPELKKRIAIFETPVHPELLTKIVD